MDIKLVGDYIIFGTSSGKCRFCNMALDLLAEKEIDYTIYDTSFSEYREILKNLRGLDDLKGQTIPQVFKNDGKGGWDFIGGYKELKEHLG